MNKLLISGANQARESLDKPDLPTDAPAEQSLIKERTDALFTTMASSAIINLLATGVGATVFLDPGNRTFVVMFVLAAFLLLLIRIALLSAYRRHSAEPSIHWARAAAVCTFISGSTWGSAIYWATRHGSDHQVLIITCLALGAVCMAISYVAYAPAFIALEFSTLSLAAISFTTSGRPGHLQIGIASIFLCFGLAINGRKLGGRIVDSMHIASENKLMAARLSEYANALEKANVDLEVLSHTDVLTGLANRRRFIMELNNAWQNAIHDRSSLSLLSVDVDHFKLFNDSFGHNLGDICLKVVSSAIASSIRSEMDTAARLGGEEFALLLPHTNLDQATLVGERLRQSVRLATENPNSGLPSYVTVSIGVATLLPAEGGTPDMLLVASDKALYRSKARGRDQVS